MMTPHDPFPQPLAITILVSLFLFSCFFISPCVSCPSLWQPPFYSLLLWIQVSFFHEVPHISELTQYLSFCIWPVSLCIMYLASFTGLQVGRRPFQAQIWMLRPFFPPLFPSLPVPRLYWRLKTEGHPRASGTCEREPFFASPASGLLLLAATLFLFQSLVLFPTSSQVLAWDHVPSALPCPWLIPAYP